MNPHPAPGNPGPAPRIVDLFQPVTTSKPPAAGVLVSIQLDDVGQLFLQHAIDISRRALEAEGRTPFGAVVVVGGRIVGEGTSRVVELWDATAHAEITALRKAGVILQRHLFEDAVMYASSEPCPMCLAACYWARVPRVVYGATSYDVAASGFEDLQFYRELALPADRRSLRVEAAGAPWREQAVAALQSWVSQLPHPVEPKY